MPEVRKMLLEQLITFVHADAGGELRSDRAIELLALPMNAEEKSWSAEFLKNGKGKSLYGAKDTLIMMCFEQVNTEGMVGGRLV